ncbi:PhoU domain-containing protein [Archaeoglobus sp.]
MIENRKIYLSGGNSYIITLPKRWVESNGLKAGDYVKMEIFEDTIILKAKESEKAKKEVTLDSKGLCHDCLIRRIVAYYIAGYDSIRVKIYNEEQRRAVSLASDMLVGAEIIEDLGREIVLEIFSDPNRFSIDYIVERMGNMCLTMLSDFKQLLKGIDGFVHSSIVMRENEIDRLHFLALRLLKTEESGKTKDLLEYRTIIRALERISDHCVKMSESFMKVKVSSPKLTELVEMCEKILKVTMNSYRKRSSELADEAIEDVERFYDVEESYSNILLETLEDSWRKTESIEKTANLRIILDSLSRIAGYCSDIAEAVINMCI